MTGAGRFDHHWRRAAITGLAGFAIFAVVITVSELAAGNSVTDKDRGTTLFGGASRRDWGLAAVDLTLLTAGVIAGAVAWRMGNRVPRVGDTIVPSTAAPGLAEVGS